MADPILTTITGTIYDPFGTQLTEGNLIVSLANSFISIDGNRVAPFIKVFAMADMLAAIAQMEIGAPLPYIPDGNIAFSLFATENTVGGSSYTSLYPTGTKYTLEFDPDPSDTSIAMMRKSGYFRGTISVPHVSDTVLNNYVFLIALLPIEHLTSPKYYGNKNVLNNDPRLLQVAQKTLLTGGSNASSLHGHNEYLSLSMQSVPTGETDKVKLFYNNEELSIRFEDSVTQTLAPI